MTKKTKFSIYEQNSKEKYLGSFDYRNSEARKYLEEAFGNFSLVDFIKIIFIKEFNIPKPPRTARRTKPCFYKWFNDNFDMLKPIFDKIVIEYPDGSLIGVQKTEAENWIRSKNK